MNEADILDTPPLFYPASKKKVIFAVDNDSHLLWFYRQLLEEEGYKGLFIDDSADAIEIAKSIVPDLLIFSIELEKCSGFELLSKIREINPDVRSILITGYGKGWYSKEIRAARPDAVFVKPADFKKVDRWIATLLDIDKANLTQKPKLAQMQQINILCINNSIVATNAFQDYFRQCGFLMDAANSSEEAVMKTREKQYDILIADHSITPTPCEEMIKTIVSMENNPSAGAIYASDWTFAMQVPYIKLGMEPFFTKPICLGSIVDWIEKTIPEIRKDNS